MDANYWHKRWAENRIGWHQENHNPLLVEHFPKLTLDKGAHVFVPLCGKSKDVDWLLNKGYKVTGSELDESAVQQLFEELNLRPSITQANELKRYAAPNISVFVGDIFRLTAEQIGSVDVCYDRAAMVALPPNMRVDYAKHIIQLTQNARQLLIAFTYDQTRIEGPPHSVPAEEIEKHYQLTYEIQSLSSLLLKDGLKGLDDATEDVWLLNPR